MTTPQVDRVAELTAELELERKWHYEQADKAHAAEQANTRQKEELAEAQRREHALIDEVTEMNETASAVALENTRLQGEVERLKRAVTDEVLGRSDMQRLLDAKNAENTPLWEALRALVMAKDLRSAVQEERAEQTPETRADIRRRVHDATVALTRAWSAARKLLQEGGAGVELPQRPGGGRGLRRVGDALTCDHCGGVWAASFFDELFHAAPCTKDSARPATSVPGTVQVSCPECGARCDVAPGCAPVFVHLEGWPCDAAPDWRIDADPEPAP